MFCVQVVKTMKNDAFKYEIFSDFLALRDTKMALRDAIQPGNPQRRAYHHLKLSLGGPMRENTWKLYICVASGHVYVDVRKECLAFVMAHY